MTRKSKWVAAVALLWGLFIFVNSLQNGYNSTLMSDSVVFWLPKWFASLCGSVDAEIMVVRKTAHFLEYLALGGLVSLSFAFSGGLRLKNAGDILFPCLAWAAADEFLQTFIAGRTGKVADIWLDFGGALAGVLLIVLIRKLWRRLHQPAEE